MPASPVNEQLLNHVIELYTDEGLTLRKIAQRVPYAEETIRRWLRQAGVELRPRGQPPGKHLPRGGRIIDASGYILVRAPDHPHANSGGYVYEHRWIVEQALGRYLLPEEVVHHLDGDKQNNDLENLRLFSSRSEQNRETLLGNERARGDSENPRRAYNRRKFRTSDEVLEAIRELAASLDRPIRRTDLQPPAPSYTVIARLFGSWQKGVEAALRTPSPAE
jgi:hypothetical protein